MSNTPKTTFHHAIVYLIISSSYSYYLNQYCPFPRERYGAHRAPDQKAATCDPSCISCMQANIGGVVGISSDKRGIDGVAAELARETMIDVAMMRLICADQQNDIA